MKTTQSPPMPDDEDLRKWNEYIYSKILNKFDNRSSLYKYFQDNVYRNISKLLGNKTNISVVDCGCGTGRLLNKSGYKFEKYYGFDVDNESINLAKQNHPNYNFQNKDITNLPLPTSTIDYFVSVYTLEHLFNLQAACYEMVRVLKPNGILIAALPIEENIFINIIRKFTSCKVLKKEYDIDYSKIIYYEHCNYTKQILRTLSYFFDIEYISYFPLKIPILPINFNVTIKAKVKSFLKKELR